MYMVILGECRPRSGWPGTVLTLRSWRSSTF